MGVVAISDLARVMVRLITHSRSSCFERANSRSRTTARRKEWEELNADEEVRRTYDLGRYLL